MDRQFNQWSCRDDLTVNSTCGSFRGPARIQFSSTHEESSENLKHSLASLGTRECIDTQSQAKEN